MTGVAHAILLAAGLGVWIAGSVTAGLVIAVGLLARAVRWGRQGKVMLRTGPGGRRVATERMLVWPGLQKLDWVDLTLKRIEVTCRGPRALPSADGLPCELRACLILRLRPQAEHVLAACDHFGIEGVASEAAVCEAFAPACEAALAEVIAGHTRAELHGLDRQEQVKQELADRVTAALAHGFALDSLALEYFEPVAPEQLADGSETAYNALSGASHQDNPDDRSADSRAGKGDTT